MSIFVQIHTLRDYPLALPNRGADGLAKRAVYGGVERQRISSQCIKRALRAATNLVHTDQDGNIVNDTLKDVASGLGLDVSVRSALIRERMLEPMLAEAGVPEEEAEAWASAVLALWRAEGSEGADNIPIVVGSEELRLLVGVVQACRSEGIETKDLRDLFEKANKLRGAPEPVKDAIHALRASKAHAGIDGALFGRMATGVGISNVDACVHVAHALTVHEIAPVGDFFSVLDDLREMGEGTAHINTAEFGSGLFYHYAVIDTALMAENIGADESHIAELVAWIIRAMATVEPAAKLGPTAPYAGLVEAMVEIGPRQPRTLMGAFEYPVLNTHGKALSEVARDALAEHAQAMDLLMGQPEGRWWLRDCIGDLPAIEGLSEKVRQNLLPAPAAAE